MSNDIAEQLARHEIYRHGSPELLKFEKNMTRYFEREYKRWSGNSNLPEHYNVSSFKGDIAAKETVTESIEHYNQQFNIYRTFLDKNYMAYTMAYYGATEETPAVDEILGLEQAQIEKFKLIVERADIANGQSILELGCGFGGFTKYLLETFPDIRVTGINPSVVQTTYLKENLVSTSDVFKNGRFTLVQKYFDDLTDSDLTEAGYDRAISIGVLEAVTNLDSLFKLISRALKPGGKTFHHFIVSKDTVPQLLNAEDTLIANYFPGGHIWPYAEPFRHDRHLTPERSWFVNGMNYWKTLDEWHKGFWDAIDQLYPEILTIEQVDDWNKYFCLCKAMFSPNEGRSYGVGHFLYRK